MTYSEPSTSDFWEKITHGFKKMGGEVAILAITLWLVMTDPKTPISIKITIGSALAYLIMPVDMIPDFIPVTGYADDLAALSAAATAAGTSITEEHKTQAREKWEAL
ncbi:DUF1232 domain-containing protein [Vibrio alfacsensis]|uniref:DUF1232 domain-containing protein n=1 Tax=Vibrio alfacsensis TaxID=1074311 RepID=A0ABN5PC89_9VIBR|nr:DUF1232 domain-containing protein [Vibrio alfacsensis]AXY00920.1 DUF1232 domain-containing protein [Vibrio alfacsensis]